MRHTVSRSTQRAYSMMTRTALSCPSRVLNEQVEYTWDANGNMTSDLKKGLTEIKYNILNLPERITHSDGHITYITYAADGRKLRVTYKIDPTATIEPGEPFLPHGSISPLGQQIMANGLNGGDIQHPIDDPVAMDVIMTRDYCGAYTYRNGSIERILMGNGFLQDSVYYVQVKDYQGNVRAVLDQSRNLVEHNEYYPYGGLINASDTQLQPYKYSSKELDRENGLDLYDSQARWYDPMLPQTTTQDPLAEKYYSISPYTWCAGNPVRFVDPNGKEVHPLGADELLMIQMTLPKEARSYVILDLNGMIDEATLATCPIVSNNILALQELVADPIVIDVSLDNKYEWKEGLNKDGIEDMDNPNPMSYLEPDPVFMNPYNSLNDLSTGESGLVGKTLFPDNEGIQNSTDGNIKVIVNLSLSLQGRAESYSHEANGHVLRYIKTRYNHKAASHQFDGKMDLNKELVKMIMESKIETIENNK